MLFKQRNLKRRLYVLLWTENIENQAVKVPFAGVMWKSLTEKDIQQGGRMDDSPAGDIKHRRQVIWLFFKKSLSPDNMSNICSPPTQGPCTFKECVCEGTESLNHNKCKRFHSNETTIAECFFLVCGKQKKKHSSDTALLDDPVQRCIFWGNPGQ